jgi:hypothetical protein
LTATKRNEEENFLSGREKIELSMQAALLCGGHNAIAGMQP